MKKTICAFLFLAASLCAFSQNMTRPVKITAKDSDTKNELVVYEVDRNVSTCANIRQTTIEYMIENKTSRILEGEFEFPLNDGEKITGFALDVNGTFRSAVAVEKQKGREVFEAVVRRGVDPGLVEMTKGNNFKTRVYPVPANGVRHLKVTCQQTIAPAETDYGKIYTQTEGKDTAFYFYEDCTLPQVHKNNPRKIDVYFDVSSSARNRSLEKEIDFLKKYIARTGAEVNVYTFSNEIHEQKNFISSKTDSLESFLKSQKFDGATSLRFNLSENSAPEIFVFSDGLVNWNMSDNLLKVPSGHSLYTVNSSSSADFAFLRNLAETNNGQFINLCEMETSAAVEKTCLEPVRVLSVQYDTSAVTHFYPQPGQIVSGGCCFTGLLVRKSADVKITLGRNGKIEKTIEKHVDCSGSDTDFVFQLLASQKIQYLQSDLRNNRSEIIRLAKEYTVVTEDVSLIVLDTAADYLRYGITPPPDLKAEYDRLASRNVSQTKTDHEIPSGVFKNFEAFRKWWNTKPEDFKKSVQKDKGEPVRPRRGPGPVMNLMAENSADEYVVVESEDMVMESARSVSNAPRMAMAKSAAGEPSVSSSQPASAVVTLQAWSSKSEYLSVLKKTPVEKMYERYLELKKDYASSPAFYIEVSDYFADEKLPGLSLRILSNLAELNLENTDVLRALGNKLMEQKNYELAAGVFEQLVQLRPEVPQFLRDLGLACHMCGKDSSAVNALWRLARSSWDGRYDQIQQVALNDMNAIAAVSKDKNLLKDVDSRLQQNFDVDLRVVLTWNTDDCDVDLWVTGPDGEKCYYAHNLTATGGKLSRDFTQGYGPEEFCIRKAEKGKYRIEANYFGNHQQKLLQPVVVQAEVYTNFGRPDQTRQVLTLQLDDVKQTFLVGEVEIK